MSTNSAQRALFLSLLGDLPAMDFPISSRIVAEEDRGSYVLQHLVLELNGIEAVPALMAMPKGEGPFPCVIYNHAHGGDYALGKNELIQGRAAIQGPYADALCAAGYAVICIDFWGFGERRGKKEEDNFKEMLWNGQVLWGMMVYDHLRVIDFVSQHERIISSRIATMGISMGSTMAWWLAALDERLKVCVDLCCMTDFQAIIERMDLSGHGMYYFVPSLLKHFTTTSINALIAPRAHLCLAGDFDRLTPPEGLRRIDADLKNIYHQAGHPENWKMLRYQIGHFETREMRTEIMAFLAEKL